MEEVKISTAGDSALLIEFGQEISPEINARITAFVHLLKAQRIEGVQDMIPAFTSLLINYDPRVVNYKTLTKRLQKLLKLDVNEETSTSRVFEIPVCYGGEYGPDIENIAKNAGLTEEEVIKIPSSQDSLIYEKKMLPVFEAADRWLDIYFQGKEPDFLPPVSFACGSEFRQEVLESVALRQEFIRLIHQEDGSYLV